MGHSWPIYNPLMGHPWTGAIRPPELENEQEKRTQRNKTEQNKTQNTKI